MAHGKVTISIDQLAVGSTCFHPVVSDVGVLLLGANTRITQHVITGLRERGFHSIEVDPRDLALIGGDERKRVSFKRDRLKDQAWTQAKPLKNFLVDRHDEALSEERATELVGRMVVAKKQFDSLKTKLETERVRSVTEFLEIADSYAHAMVDDHDQTLGVIGTSGRADGLSDRSVRMSVIGMAIAVELGLDGPKTIEVGTAGLLHDVGLYAMDPGLMKPIESMNDSERWEYQKHPLVAVQCIADAMEIPYNVQMAMEQVHEQYDGSGYPRGTKGPRIHLYARILNVVDAYLQLTSATSHRRAIIPHDALGLMLHQARYGIFDPPIIRAFLNIETLFPLGSHVELSSGEIAQVIRRPRSGYSTPVVQNTQGERIDLEQASTRVVRPAHDPAVEQVRLTQQMMLCSDWNPAHDSLVL